MAVCVSKGLLIPMSAATGFGIHDDVDMTWIAETINAIVELHDRCTARHQWPCAQRAWIFNSAQAQSPSFFLVLLPSFVPYTLTEFGISVS